MAHISKLGASELSKYNIRVNAVLPGLIGTHIFGKGFGLDNEEAQKVAELLAEHAGAMQPIGRIGQGADIAEMVAFLGSDAAAFVTGGEFVVDGGMTIRDFNRSTDCALPDDEANTIAGLVIHEAQMIPTQGQVFSFHGFRFEVTAREGNRITELKIRALPGA